MNKNTKRAPFPSPSHPNTRWNSNYGFEIVTFHHFLCRFSVPEGLWRNHPAFSERHWSVKSRAPAVGRKDLVLSVQKSEVEHSFPWFGRTVVVPADSCKVFRHLRLISENVKSVSNRHTGALYNCLTCPPVYLPSPPNSWRSLWVLINVGCDEPRGRGIVRVSFLWKKRNTAPLC